MFSQLLVIEIPVVISYRFAPVKVFSNILFTVSVVPLSTSFAFLRHSSLWFKFQTKYCFRALFAGYVWYKQDTQCTQNVPLWLVHIHSCNGKATVPSRSIVELHVTVKYIKILSVAQICFMVNFCGRNNETYLGLRVKCTIFVPDVS
jgi:hypothetical protein